MAEVKTWEDAREEMERIINRHIHARVDVEMRQYPIFVKVDTEDGLKDADITHIEYIGGEIHLEVEVVDE